MKQPPHTPSAANPLSYAWANDEARFEWSHITRRRLFRNAANFPLAMVEWKITNPKKSFFNNDNKGLPIFWGMVLKQTLDTFVKFGLSDFVRSASQGFLRNRHFEELMELAGHAHHHADALGAPHTHRSAHHRAVAMRLASGDLAVTHDSASHISEYAQGLQQKTVDLKDAPVTSENVGHWLRAAALLVQESAMPLSNEIYEALPKPALSRKDAAALGKLIAPSDKPLKCAEKAASFIRKKGLEAHATKLLAEGLPETRTQGSAAMHLLMASNSDVGWQRPEVKHEMMKVFGRSLPNYLLQFPISVLSRKIIADEKISKPVKIGTAGIPNELFVGLYQLATVPFAESFVGTGMFEATRQSLHGTLAEAHRAHRKLKDAIAQAGNLDNAWQDQGRNILDPEPWKELQKRHAQSLSDPASAGFHAYLVEVAELTERKAAQLFESFGMDPKAKDPGAAYLAQIFQNGPQNLHQAMALLTLTEALLATGSNVARTMEYIPPGVALLDESQLGELSRAINSAFAKSDMGDAALIQASQKILTALRGHGLDANAVQKILEHRLQVDYIDAMESALFRNFKFPKLAMPLERPQDALAIPAMKLAEYLQPDFLSCCWRSLTRPEVGHETGMLRDRQAFVSLFNLPVRMLENLLRGDVKNLLTGKNIGNALFQGITTTFAMSYGAVFLRELTQLKDASAKEAAARLADVAEHLAMGDSPRIHELTPESQSLLELAARLRVSTDAMDRLHFAPNLPGQLDVEAMKRLTEQVAAMAKEESIILGEGKITSKHGEEGIARFTEKLIEFSKTRLPPMPEDLPPAILQYYQQQMLGAAPRR